MVDSAPDEPAPSRPTPIEPAALTRGFLFCDLRGYTAFVEEHGDRAAAELLEAYRTMVRSTIEPTGGGEIRTEGDSFYLVFPSASAAIRCGLAIVEAARQAAVDQPERPIRVGVGIHAGESVEHREGYVGSAVNIAARVCAQASAGEVLVTETVRSLVRTTFNVRFVSRGRRHLKGIEEPITLFAVTDAVAPIGGLRRPKIRPHVQRAWLGIGIAIAVIFTAVVLGLFVLGNGALAPEPLAGRIVFRSTQRLGPNGVPAGQVYVAKPDGTARRQLTPLTVNVLGFRPRPDWGKIVYVTPDNIAIANIDDSGSTGSWPGPWRLPDFYQGAPLIDIALFAWLPSGELLIEEGHGTVDSPRTIARLAANGQSLVPIGPGECAANSASLASGEDLAVAPDGRSVAFRTVHDLWIVPPDGCGIQVTQEVDASQPAWSPDGSRIVLRGASPDGATDIWVVNANGAGLRRLTSDSAADEQPTWSPDGAWIAWSRSVAAGQRLWVMRADGSDPHELPIGDPGEELDSPVWAPDPKPAASSSQTAAVPNPFAIIGSYSASMLGLDQPVALAIGPDGNVYITDRSPSVTAVDAFGARVTRWGAQGAGPGDFDFGGRVYGHASIAVGPDGRVYVSDSGNDRVQVFEPGGKFVRQFGVRGTEDGQFMEPFDLSVDAAGNVYVLDDETRNLQKFSPTGQFLWKVDESVLPDMTGHGHDANIDSQGRIVVGNDDNGRVLYLDPTGREVDAFDARACGVTVDTAGNTYIGGCGSDSVEVFDPSHHLIGRWSGPDMPLDGPPEFGPDGEIFALGKDGSLITLTVTLPGQ